MDIEEGQLLFPRQPIKQFSGLIIVIRQPKKTLQPEYSCQMSNLFFWDICLVEIGNRVLKLDSYPSIIKDRTDCQQSHENGNTCHNRCPVHRGVFSHPGQVENTTVDLVADSQLTLFPLNNAGELEVCLDQRAFLIWRLRMGMRAESGVSAQKGRSRRTRPSRW